MSFSERAISMCRVVIGRKGESACVVEDNQGNGCMLNGIPPTAEGQPRILSAFWLPNGEIEVRIGREAGGPIEVRHYYSLNEYNYVGTIQ